jgi:hypothetical protein
LFNCGFDSVAAEVAVKESTDLFSGQSVGAYVDGLADTVRGGIAGGCAEKEGGSCEAVVPYGEAACRWGSAMVELPSKTENIALRRRTWASVRAGGGAVDAGAHLA